MRLHSFKIEGFKRLRDVDLLFGDATFLIGSNNTGKSTALKALDYFLSGAVTIPSEEFYSEKDEDTGANIIVAENIIFEAEFRDVPEEANNWKGLQGKLFIKHTLH